VDIINNRRVALKRTQKVGKVLSREFEVMNMLKNQPNVV